MFISWNGMTVRGYIVFSSSAWEEVLREYDRLCAKPLLKSNVIDERRIDNIDETATLPSRLLTRDPDEEIKATLGYN